ncbi:MAG: diaminopimelate epimerase [Planctomycetota bacterium]
MKFVKMHGAANDYVYVDCFDERAPADPAALAPLIADRHRGVGGDGLVLVLPSTVATARMRMFNADGSESEMCGNGVRCVAHLVVSRGRAPAGPVTIETGRGVLTLEVQRTGSRTSQVRVDMGEPVLEAESIPVLGSGRIVAAACEALGAEEAWWAGCGLEPRMTCVSMGNPHAVFFCAAVALVPLEAIGPRVETHPIFPRRVNVHFVEVVSPRHVRMRTWERGSGITMACGTGASAVCVAGVLTGRTERAIDADLPGGRLRLEWPEGGHVFMTGPAEEVFQGNWPDA